MIIVKFVTKEGIIAFITGSFSYFACINSTGCQETSSQYYITNPEARKFLTKNEKRLKDLMGPYLMEIIGPALYVVAGGTSTVKISKHFSLQTDKKMLFFLLGKIFK